jgi:phospholipid/cholesterol/gamma-HCH transport system substrate-binding protein
MGREIKLGILTLITAAAVIFGYQYIKGNNLLSSANDYYSLFDEVTDLAVASPVMVNGYKVGVVKAITLDPANVNNIRVDYDINKDIKVPKTAVAKLKAVSAIGGRMLELDFEKMCTGSDCAAPGQELKGESLGLLGSMLGTEDVSAYGTALGGSLKGAIGKLGDKSSDAPLDATIRNLEVVTANLANATNNMNSLLLKSEKNLTASLRNFASISSNLAENNQQITSMISNLDLASQKFSNLQIDKTLVKTDAAIDQAGTSLKEMQNTMVEATEAISSLKDVITKIDSGDGSLAKLMNDKQLYDNLELTSQNLALLLQDLRLNPKRYVNVSVFGKKSKEYVKPENDPAFQNKGN